MARWVCFRLFRRRVIITKRVYCITHRTFLSSPAFQPFIPHFEIIEIRRLSSLLQIDTFSTNSTTYIAVAARGCFQFRTKASPDASCRASCIISRKTIVRDFCDGRSELLKIASLPPSER